MPTTLGPVSCPESAFTPWLQAPHATGPHSSALCARSGRICPPPTSRQSRLFLLFFSPAALTKALRVPGSFQRVFSHSAGTAIPPTRTHWSSCFLLEGPLPPSPNWIPQKDAWHGCVLRAPCQWGWGVGGHGILAPRGTLCGRVLRPQVWEGHGSGGVARMRMKIVCLRTPGSHGHARDPECSTHKLQQSGGGRPKPVP